MGSENMQSVSEPVLDPLECLLAHPTSLWWSTGLRVAVTMCTLTVLPLALFMLYEDRILTARFISATLVQTVVLDKSHGLLQFHRGFFFTESCLAS